MLVLKEPEVNACIRNIVSVDVDDPEYMFSVPETSDAIQITSCIIASIFVSNTALLYVSAIPNGVEVDSRKNMPYTIRFFINTLPVVSRTVNLTVISLSTEKTTIIINTSSPVSRTVNENPYH
jgi:hypothetical protein